MNETAKEFLKSYLEAHPNCKYDEVMVEFAKLHVLAALNVASEEAYVVYVSNPKFSDLNHQTAVVNKDSILYSYPLENIK